MDANISNIRVWKIPLTTIRAAEGTLWPIFSCFSCVGYVNPNRNLI